MNTSEPGLILYTRAGCSLCEKAAGLLLEHAHVFRRVDIGGDATLEALYGFDIPVLARGDTVLLKGVFSRARLEKLGL